LSSAPPAAAAAAGGDGDGPSFPSRTNPLFSPPRAAPSLAPAPAPAADAPALSSANPSLERWLPHGAVGGLRAFRGAGTGAVVLEASLPAGALVAAAGGEFVVVDAGGERKYRPLMGGRPVRRLPE